MDASFGCAIDLDTTRFTPLDEWSIDTLELETPEKGEDAQAAG